MVLQFIVQFELPRLAAVTSLRSSAQSSDLPLLRRLSAAYRLRVVPLACPTEFRTAWGSRGESAQLRQELKGLQNDLAAANASATEAPKSKEGEQGAPRICFRFARVGNGLAAIVHFELLCLAADTSMCSGAHRAQTYRYCTASRRHTGCGWSNSRAPPNSEHPGEAEVSPRSCGRS